MKDKDYYGILHITPNATLQEIKAAYRFLSVCLHPDKFHGDSNKETIASNMMKEINAAYTVLIDPVKRERYDLESGQDQNEGRERIEKEIREEYERRLSMETESLRQGYHRNLLREINRIEEQVELNIQNRLRIERHKFTEERNRLTAEIQSLHNALHSRTNINSGRNPSNVNSNGGDNIGPFSLVEFLQIIGSFLKGDRI